ncbi:MAG TPA: ATPase [Candidatus Moranbacteria bacterium]|nr:ATPase [Candidatus Moranbacteria bacterium]
MQKLTPAEYSKLSALELVNSLNSFEHGLSSEEARRRLIEFGPNRLPEAKVDTVFAIFFRQFKSPLIYVLLLAAMVVFFTGDKTDAAVILFVLTFNAIIGMIQEGKAQNTLLALKNLTKTNATVLRDGEEMIISDEEVVRGDMLVLREGEKIPADARLIFSDSFKVNEASLTGESQPVYKTVDLKDDPNDTAFKNIVCKGTNAVSGNARAVVFATGEDTVIGGISQKMASLHGDLPFKKNINGLSKFILAAVGIISAMIFSIQLIKGVPIGEILTLVIALAVAMIPEGLPIVVTLVLAKGVWSMSRMNVLVKKLQAVEALGQTHIIAVDKTGTITRNELIVEEIFVGGKFFKVSGSGYEPKGEITHEGKLLEPLNNQGLLLAGKISALCSNAHLSFSEKNKSWKLSGDPTEAANLVLSKKIGFNKEDLEEEMKKLDEFPFDYELRYHAILHSDGSVPFLSAIGAPEVILGMSEDVWSDGKIKKIDESERKKLATIFDEMSKKGLRVIGFGFKEVDMQSIPEKMPKIVFGGFLGIKDAIREDVFEAVEKVKKAGIKLIMITGDYPSTAVAIAEEAGIFEKGDKILTGKEVEELSEEKLSRKIDKVTVYARVNPMHKLKIINAYKIRGEKIAMTGDGVNDALSLTASDVGVAMGKIGTEVAKEAGDIILLDDNFGSIVSGVEEGRNIYKTIKKVILYLFSTNLGIALTIIGSIALGIPLPILAAQILWLNLVTDGFLDVSLAMEPKSAGLLEKKFEKEQASLVDKLMIKRMILMALPMAIGTLFLFGMYYESDLKKAWTVSLTVMAVFQWFNAWNCRSHVYSIFRSDPFSNKYLLAATGIVIILQTLAVYNPLFQKILKTSPLAGVDWILIVLVAFSIVVIEEVRKLIYRRSKK